MNNKYREVNNMNDIYLLPNAEKEIIDSYDEDIIITNRDGNIIKASQISGLHYDLTAKELLGQSVYDLETRGIFSPAITPLVLKQRKKVVLIQTTPTDKKILITGVPLFNQQHEVEFVISYSYEVSELLVIQEYLDGLEDEMSMVKDELALLREKSVAVEGIVQESKHMQQIITSVNKVAPINVSTIIYGESGVGKSTIAKLIHKTSAKGEGAFIEVNCAAIPDAIFDYELTGRSAQHSTQKTGYIQMAQSGTLYLQGVDELSLVSQTTLLKILQQVKQNVRIISSSEANLEELVANKKFREDLYYLLHIVPIHLKPLRERLEDLSVIIQDYVGHFTSLYKLDKRLSDDLLHELLHFEWAGNQLEVKNLMERLVVQSESQMITTDDLPIEYQRNDSEFDQLQIEGRTLPTILENVEKRVLLSARKRYKTTTEIAIALGISQPSVVRKLKKYANS